MGVYALYLALPVILSMMTNAFYIALLGIAIFALVSIGDEQAFPQTHLYSVLYAMPQINRPIVDIDPVDHSSNVILRNKEREA